MFDIGWSELLVIGIVALVVIGPKELPGVIRGIGQMLTKVRRMAADFQGQFNEALREAELADLKKSVDEVREGVSGLRSMTNPLSAIESQMREAMETPPAATPAPATTTTPPAAAPPASDPPAIAQAAPAPAIDLPTPEPAPVDLTGLSPPAAPTVPPAAEPAGGKPA